MTFPTTGLLDDFNRTDGDSTVWLGVDSNANSGFKVVSLQATGRQPGATAYYVRDTAKGPDVELYLDTTQQADFDNLSFYLRATGMAAFNFGTGNGYQLVFSFSNSVGPRNGMSINGYKVVNSSTILLYDPAVITNMANVPLNGDKVGVSAVGNTFKFFVKVGSNPWTEVGSFTDSTFTGAGALMIGLGNDATTNTIDNVSGGTVLAAGDARVYPNTFALSFTQNPVTVRVDATIVLAQKSLSLTLNPVTVRTDVTVMLGLLTLSFTQQSVSVAAGASALLNALALTFSQNPVDGVSGDANTALNAQALTFALLPAGVRGDSNVLLAALKLVFAQLPVTVDADQAIQIGSHGVITIVRSKAQVSVNRSKARMTIGD